MEGRCHTGRSIMKGERGEQWMRLCDLAAKEQDHEKFMNLIEEIHRLLMEKEERLKGQNSSQNS